MREIAVQRLADVVARLCQEANTRLGGDVVAALQRAREEEESPLGREILGALLDNAHIAAVEGVPLCQDCGTAMVFLEIGQDVHLIGGDLNAAIAQGVSRGYTEGYLRQSMVNQPFSARRNTQDNTPPMLHTWIVPGDGVKVTVMPKGGGAENMTRLAMLRPADGREGLVSFVVQAVEEAGANPCPPTIVGVGVGGTAEVTLLLAKRALLRPVRQPSPDPETAQLEQELLAKINRLGLGPLGFGGRITALAVHVETLPCHMVSLPVAVNLQCHSARHRETVL